MKHLLKKTLSLTELKARLARSLRWSESAKPKPQNGFSNGIGRATSLSSGSYPRTLNLLIALFSAVLLVYLLADTLFTDGQNTPLHFATATRLEERADVIRTTPEPPTAPKADEYMKPFSYYEAAFRQQNIFRPTARPERKKGSMPKRAIRLSELASSLVVTGIFLDQNPQAVIMDTRENRTYFVSEGQYIQEMLVKEIGKGKVTLTYKGEEMSLFF